VSNREIDDEAAKPPPAPIDEATETAALTRLIRGLAHDFNNLLAIITGNVQLARERIRDPDAQA
jgi:nitrogen-specific signal transduction histidine kinase